MKLGILLVGDYEFFWGWNAKEGNDVSFSYELKTAIKAYYPKEDITLDMIGDIPTEHWKVHGFESLKFNSTMTIKGFPIIVKLEEIKELF